MPDDRNKPRRYPRPKTPLGTPVSILPAPHGEFDDDDPTPAPVDVEQAISWRRFDERLDRLELGLGAFQQSFPRLEGMFHEFALPMLKESVASIDGLLQRQERNSTRLELFFDQQWPALTEAVDLLAERLGRIERKQDDFVSALALHNERIARAEKALAEIEARLDRIERRTEDTALADGAAKAERLRWFSWAKAGIAAGAAAVTFIAARWSDIVSWLTP